MLAKLLIVPWTSFWMAAFGGPRASSLLQVILASFASDSSMPTLSHALATADMLLIDGLHAFDFALSDRGLTVECMDGRQLRRWNFSPDQVAQACAEGNDWRIEGAQGEHRLVLMSAVRAPEEDVHEPDLQAPADRQPDDVG